MFNFLIIILIIVIYIDILFYIPIPIHLYIDNECFYVYVYSFKVIKIDKVDNYNYLKDKITLENIKKTDKENIKLIKTINIKKLFIEIKKEIADLYPYLFYPLLVDNKVIKIKLTDNNKLYNKIEIRLVNVLYSLIKIRSKKHERTSNKWHN